VQKACKNPILMKIQIKIKMKTYEVNVILRQVF